MCLSTFYRARKETILPSIKLSTGSQFASQAAMLFFVAALLILSATACAKKESASVPDKIPTVAEVEKLLAPEERNLANDLNYDQRALAIVKQATDRRGLSRGPFCVSLLLTTMACIERDGKLSSCARFSLIVRNTIQKMF